MKFVDGDTVVAFLVGLMTCRGRAGDEGPSAVAYRHGRFDATHRAHKGRPRSQRTLALAHGRHDFLRDGVGLRVRCGAMTLTVSEFSVETKIKLPLVGIPGKSWRLLFPAGSDFRGSARRLCQVSYVARNSARPLCKPVKGAPA